MKKFKIWFNKFELKRRIFLIVMVLYAIVSIGALPYFHEKISLSYLIIYGIVTAAFIFQYLYVEITDHREYERKLFNKK